MSSESDLDPPSEPGWLPVILAALAVFFTLAALVGRDDGFDDLDAERALDWLVIGPLWGAVAYFYVRQRLENRKASRIVAGCLAVVAWLLLSIGSQWWTDMRGEERLKVPREMCLDKMHRVVVGLHNYASSQNGLLPPAYQSDAAGRPMHSWRALITANELLLTDYRWKEPWDGPQNSKAVESEIAPFWCPLLSKKGETSFLVIVGPKTAFPGAKPASLRQLSPRTILFVAVKNSGIKWFEPRDLTVDEAIRGLRGSGRMKITHVAFANGEIQPVAEMASVEGLVLQLQAAAVEPAGAASN
jgi:hypothetical protein